MKKIAALLLAISLILVLFAGCAGGGDDKVITVGATVAPHAAILEVAKPVLEEAGYELNIVEYNDYVLPNVALTDGDLDANYFQHLTYLNNYNEENGTDLVSAGAIHYEPLGIYPGKSSSLDDIADGAQITVPNDASNEARALKLLEDNGLITLDPDAGANAVVTDIVETPHNLKITEIEAAQLTRSLEDVDFAVINGNYAMQAGLNVATDSLAMEEADSDAATAYANVVAVRNGEENSEKIQALVDALKSEEVRQFIDETYAGSVVILF